MKYQFPKGLGMQICHLICWLVETLFYSVYSGNTVYQTKPVSLRYLEVFG